MRAVKRSHGPVHEDPVRRAFMASRKHTTAVDVARPSDTQARLDAQIDVLMMRRWGRTLNDYAGRRHMQGWRRGHAAGAESGYKRGHTAGYAKAKGRKKNSDKFTARNVVSSVVGHIGWNANPRTIKQECGTVLKILTWAKFFERDQQPPRELWATRHWQNDWPAPQTLMREYRQQKAEATQNRTAKL